MNAIILFYKYINLENPNAILKWQKKLCQNLALKGRIILAAEGINGTLAGSQEAIESYKLAMNQNSLFTDIDFKESWCDSQPFPRLRIVVKKEIVHLGLDPNMVSAQQAGIHLEPSQAHELIAQNPSDLIIIDCRNKVESAIGKIEGCIIPDVDRFRDFPAYVDQNIEQFKNKQILMYCTGGVRCERASAYIKSKMIAKEVFHIKGGIHRYVEAFPNGFFKGKNYVFDGRTAVKVTDDILGTCFICHAACDNYTNCLRATCNRHFICCDNCLKIYQNTCSAACKDLINNGDIKRPQPLKCYKTNEHTNQPIK